MINIKHITHNKEKYQSILNNLYNQKQLQHQNQYKIKTMFYSELLEKINLINLYANLNDIHDIQYSGYLSYDPIDSNFLSGDSNIKIAVEAKNRNVEKFDILGKYQDYEIIELTKLQTFFHYHQQGLPYFLYYLL